MRFFGASVLSLFLASTALAQPYVRTVVPGKTFCLAWPRRAYTFYVHSPGSARTPGTTEFDAIDKSFQSWRQLASTCSDFTFTKAGTVDTVKIGYVPGETNQNVITFREESCSGLVPPSDPCFDESNCGNKYNCWDHSEGTIALTTTTFSFRTGVIYDADIEFNAGDAGGPGFLFTTVDSPPCDEAALSTSCIAADVQNTLTHEIGHVVGLDHVDNPGATMEPSAPTGELQKRLIDTGTAAGFCETYPAGALTPPCDGVITLSTHVYAVNKGTNTGCSSSAEAPMALIAWGALNVLRRRRRPKAGF
jgi:uncharacterized protein (TIGR03382 family)